MRFSDLNLSKSLLNALDDLGFTEPTTIQQKAFSPVMSGRDVCGIAQTGTGKTLAYLLPCLRQFQFSKDRFPQLLILVPTRELVLQVVAQVEKLTTYMQVAVLGVYGGVNMNPQIAAVENGGDVIVATPGRLLDLALHGSLKLKAVKRLVIDEMDELLDQGFRAQLNRILDLLPPKRQNLLFSATIAGEVEQVIDIYFNNPVRIEAAPSGTPLAHIDQSYYEVPNFNTKVNLLELLLRRQPEMSKVLVFAATKGLADLLHERLEALFPGEAGVIHSNKAQNQRFQTVERFREGVYRLIIATDIVARGIDISEVTHVVNFDLPEEPESYIHRIGRTGRADRKGIAIAFVTEKEKPLQEAIEALMQYQIPEVLLPEDLEISEVLIEEERPKVRMKTDYLPPLPLPEQRGAAFHQKQAKNQKVNKKVRHSDKMREKYGKPKKRDGRK